eukprot:m.221800 g.221800  ORF g.221800 m.221800 type:complete len:404 (-) comp13846_c0_seq2:3654-4865(-)
MSIELSKEVIASGASKLRRRKDEKLENFLERITHLKLQRRQIQSLNFLNLCKKLVALYLYENLILKMTNLSACHNLTYIYLQDNQIGRLEGIGKLKFLSKLFIGRNKIVVVEGLHELPNLTELHIEHQHLPPGEKLLFDPRSIATISKTVKKLNVAGNGLTSIMDFTSLACIEKLDVSHNRLTDLNEFGLVFGHSRTLHTLNVVGNPFCSLMKYVEEVVTQIPHLNAIDGREFNETQRAFLLNWKTVLQKRAQDSDNSKKSNKKKTLSRPSIKYVKVWSWLKLYVKTDFFVCLFWFIISISNQVVLFLSFFQRRQGVSVKPRFKSRLRSITHSPVLPPISGPANTNTTKITAATTSTTAVESKSMHATPTPSSSMKLRQRSLQSLSHKALPLSSTHINTAVMK